MNQKLQKALELSEEILENIELENEKIEAVLLKCLRLARLMGDNKGIEWLQYEIQGYPKNKKGYIEPKAWFIAKEHNRSFFDKEQEEEYIFSELVSQLETLIELNYKNVNNITTNGVSFSGDYSNVAMSNLVRSARENGQNIATLISEQKKRLSILKGEFYKYALNINLELNFSKSAEDIFDRYRTLVDTNLSEIIGDSEEKLSAIYDRLSEDNKESWSQAADTCRKLFKSVADNLFAICYPSYKEKILKVKSGKEVDITGDKYKNRLLVCLDNIDKLSNKHLVNTIEWIDELNNKICDGVHNDITYREIQQAIIHTYICLGDIISGLLNNEKKLI